MSQVTADSGAVKAYYSWKVQNPSEALHDVMMDVSDQKGSDEVYIPWDADAETNAERVQTAIRTRVISPLYGALVGAGRGLNKFTLWYKDSAVVHTGYWLSLLSAAVVFIRNYFCALL